MVCSSSFNQFTIMRNRLPMSSVGTLHPTRFNSTSHCFSVNYRNLLLKPVTSEYMIIANIWLWIFLNFIEITNRPKSENYCKPCSQGRECALPRNPILGWNDSSILLDLQWLSNINRSVISVKSNNLHNPILTLFLLIKEIWNP